MARRKQEEFEFKRRWLSLQNQTLEFMRERNIKLRNDTKENIEKQRQKHYFDNILTREKQKYDLNSLNEKYNIETQKQIQERDKQVAQIYNMKKAAKERNVFNFTQNLIQVRNSCEK